MSVTGSSHNVEQLYDRWGRVAYTFLEIWFPMYVDPKSTELQDWVHAVINRLLEVYRFATKEFHVDVVPKNELWEYEAFSTNEDGRTFPSPIHCVRMMPFGYGTRLARSAPISEEAKRFLSDGTRLPLAQTLYLNAQREHLLENHRLAVVEAETAFEALVDKAVVSYYREQGHPEEQIEKKLEAGLRNLIRDHIPRCCGQPFEGTAEYEAWDADLYKVRNDVVHNGASVSPEQVEKALSAAGEALGWLERHLLAADNSGPEPAGPQRPPQGGI
jgi:hypothetical protein